MRLAKRILNIFYRIIVVITISVIPGQGMSAEVDEPILPLPPTNESPTVSPDGKEMLFVSDATGTSTIWIARRDGAQTKPFINWRGTVQKDPDWSPDGRRVVFASNIGGTDFNIWSVAATGSDPIKLTNASGSNTQPRYSPDGSKIAFVSNRTGKRELWYMQSDGRGQVAVGLQSLIVSDPTWSPDGTALAFVGCTRPANGNALDSAPCNLFVIALDASSARRLTSGVFQDWEPDWSPAGIVFSSSRGGGQRLWKINPAVSGAQPQPVSVDDKGMETTPRWDKLTSAIVFARSTGTSNVWSLDVNGFETKLTDVIGYSTAGDIDTDGAITCADVTLLRSSFGKRATQPGYDLRADVNGDGIVDVRDLAAVSSKLPTGSICK